MNEPLIRDSTPNGNVILAYGEAANRNPFGTIALVIPGLVLLVVLTIALRTLFSATLPIPHDVAMIAYVPSSATLPADSPRLWLDAERDAAPLPLFVGYTVDERGERHPFAVTRRALGAGTTQTSWIWRLRQEQDAPYERKTPRALATAWRDYGSAWLRVWPGRLAPSFGAGSDADQSFGGPLTSNGWMTTLPAPIDTTERDRILGQNFLDTAALPGSWDALQQTFRVYDFDVRLRTPPAVVRWSLDESSRLSVALEFSEPLDGTARAQLAAASGIFDRTTYALPDGTVVTENRLPTGAVLAATSTMFEEKTALLGSSELLTRESILPENCKGHILAVFDGIGAQNLLERLGFSFLPAHDQLILREKSGKVEACW